MMLPVPNPWVFLLIGLIVMAFLGIAIYGAGAGFAGVVLAIGARVRPDRHPSTIRPDADLSPFTIGIRVSGRNAGSYRVTISGEGMAYEPGPVDDLPAVIDFDAGSLVLTTFGRVNGGTVRGDFEAAFKVMPQFAPLSETGACAQ